MSQWAKYDAYLFDLDGTLVDTAPDINAALNHALTNAGLGQVNESLTRHWVGHGSKILIDQALRHHACVNDNIETLLKDFLAYYRENLASNSMVYPGVSDTLHRMIDRGAKLAVVTNKLEELSLPLLKQIGIHDLFDAIVCGDTASAPKPDAAPIYYCLKALGRIAISDALFVGDSDTDVKAANAAGMDVVCVRDGYNHGTDVTTLKLNGVIDNFVELLA